VLAVLGDDNSAQQQQQQQQQCLATAGASAAPRVRLANGHSLCLIRRSLALAVA